MLMITIGTKRMITSRYFDDFQTVNNNPAQGKAWDKKEEGWIDAKIGREATVPLLEFWLGTDKKNQWKIGVVFVAWMINWQFIVFSWSSMLDRSPFFLFSIGVSWFYPFLNQKHPVSLVWQFSGNKGGRFRWLFCSLLFDLNVFVPFTNDRWRLKFLNKEAHKAYYKG